MLTKEQKENYIRNAGHCPYCDSTEIEAGKEDYEDNIIYDEITCNDCGKHWYDVYTLTGIQEIE